MPCSPVFSQPWCSCLSRQEEKQILVRGSSLQTSSRNLGHWQHLSTFRWYWGMFWLSLLDAGCSFLLLLQVLKPSVCVEPRSWVWAVQLWCTTHAPAFIILLLFYIYSVKTGCKEIFILSLRKGKQWSSSRRQFDQPLSSKIPEADWTEVWTSWTELTSEPAFWAGDCTRLFPQVPPNYLMKLYQPYY